jgi:hydroxymethylpyrimidine/phosphomethylpyrimidine kinase
MLTTVPVIRGVAALLRSLETPVVVDPMVGGPGGVRLLRPLSLACLIRDILPLATLVTLNLPDACALAGVAIRNEADVKVAARRIQALGPRAVLITGERGDERVVADGLLDGRTWLCFESSRPESPQVMDAGGALAAVTVAYLALGETLPDALQRAVSRVRQTASR